MSVSGNSSEQKSRTYLWRSLGERGRLERVVPSDLINLIRKMTKEEALPCKRTSPGKVTNTHIFFTGILGNLCI